MVCKQSSSYWHFHDNSLNSSLLSMATLHHHVFRHFDENDSFKNVLFASLVMKSV